MITNRVCKTLMITNRVGYGRDYWLDPRISHWRWAVPGPPGNDPNRTSISRHGGFRRSLNDQLLNSGRPDWSLKAPLITL